MPTLIDTHVHRPMMSEAMGCLGVVPIVFGVAVLMNLFIGESDLPRELAGSTPWFGLGFALSAVLAVGFWFRNRIRFTLLERDAVHYIEIYDPKGPIVLQGPFEVQYGWNPTSAGRGPDMTLLIVGLVQDGELVVSFTEVWGAIYGAPKGWPTPFALKGPAKASYTAAGRTFCVSLVDALAPRGR